MNRSLEEVMAGLTPERRARIEARSKELIEQLEAEREAMKIICVLEMDSTRADYHNLLHIDINAFDSSNEDEVVYLGAITKALSLANEGALERKYNYTFGIFDNEVWERTLVDLPALVEGSVTLWLR